MTCRATSKLLSAYLDAQLPAAQAARVVAHLRDCPSCRGGLESLRATTQLVGSLATPRLAVDLAPSVMARSGGSPWGAPWHSVGACLAARQAFLARQFGRAVAVVALFLLAAAGPRPGSGSVLLFWPTHVAGTAQAGVLHLCTGLAEAGALLERATRPPQTRGGGGRAQPHRTSPPRR